MADQSGHQGDDEFGRQSSGLICQSCGVTVAPGYPKCPKCHHAMPTVASPLARHGTPSAGGTSAASDTGSFAMWIALAAVAIIVVGVILFVARSGEDDAQTEGAQAPVAARDAGGEEEVDDTAEPAPVEVVAADEGDAAEAVTPESALEDLEQQLSERRLYSKVEQDEDDGSVVRIESAQCDDPGMREAIAQVAGNLSSAGLVQVRCFSQHGTLSFESAL